MSAPDAERPVNQALRDHVTSASFTLVLGSTAGDQGAGEPLVTKTQAWLLIAAAALVLVAAVRAWANENRRR